jgi:hypothetical protein
MEKCGTFAQNKHSGDRKTVITKQWLYNTTPEYLLDVVFSVCSMPLVYNGDSCHYETVSEAAVTGIGGWFEMAISLKGHENRSRGTSIVGRL